MRRLFIVGAKLLGLLCLWWAISTTIQLISFGSVVVMVKRADVLDRVAIVLVYGVGLLAYFVLAVWFALVLLFRTEWIADKVRLEKDSDLPGWPEQNKLLSLGVVLLGFYVLAHAIPEAVKSSLTLLGDLWLKTQPEYRDWTTIFLQYVIPVLRDVLGVAVGCLLILMPTRIIQWAKKAQKTLDHKLTKQEGHLEKGED